MARLYVYKLTCDNNGAPCVHRGRLSLAICKPNIRRTAKEGDYIFGFAANSLHRDNRLIYIARVTETVSDGQYYTDERFEKRPDCIYEERNGKFSRRKNALYHGEAKDIEHDLGMHPEYKNARVVLSNDFRYFGNNGTAEYANRYPRIRRAISLLKRGHRVNHGDDLQAELRALVREIWTKYSSMKLGPASEGARRSTCMRHP